MNRLNKLLGHRQLINPLNVTLLMVLTTLLCGLVITPIVFLCNPWFIGYVRKMFRKV